MARYTVKLSTITRRLPRTYALSKGFQTFIDECRSRKLGDIGWFRVEYTNPNLLFPGSSFSIVPFLTLPAADVVAFWFRSRRSTPQIVWLSSEGEARVIASSWSEFVARLAARETSLPDLDDRESETFPLKSTAKKRDLSRFQSELDKWIDNLAPKQRTLQVPNVVKEIMGIVSEERPFCEYGAATTLVLTSQETGIKVEWFNGGLVDFPASSAKKLIPFLEKVQEQYGEPFNATWLSVFPDGAAYLDREIEIR